MIFLLDKVGHRCQNARAERVTLFLVQQNHVVRIEFRQHWLCLIDGADQQCGNFFTFHGQQQTVAGPAVALLVVALDYVRCPIVNHAGFAQF